MGLTEMLDGFGDVELVVVGDAVLDCWLAGPARSLSREAPVPVVTVDGVTCAPGGAANTAVNVAALGGVARFVTVVGADADGRRLTGELRDAGVDTAEVLASPGWRTTAKRRLVADGHVLARLDETPHAVPPPRVERELGDRLDRVLSERPRHVLVCDYGTGVLTDRIRDLLAAHRPRMRSLVVDAHDPTRWAPARPTAVTPDLAECRTVLGVPETDHADGVDLVTAQAGRLVSGCGAAAVAATLGEHGALLLRDGHAPIRAAGVRAPAAHATGAGDAFAAAFALSLAGGHDWADCLRMATEAAGSAVGHSGTSVCDVRRLRHPSGLVDLGELSEQVRRHRAAGRRIVFTNGCFDLLHRGHVAYLRQARDLGDVLVLGLNSDRSVRRLKGPDRPVNRCEDRAAVLAALSCVDLVCAFDEDSPTRLLRAVRPDVYVKGGDYTPEMLPETSLVRSLGGQVRIVDYVGRHSTSTLLDRIRQTEHLS